LSKSLHEKALDALIKAYDLANIREPFEIARGILRGENDYDSKALIALPAWKCRNLKKSFQNY